MYVYAPRQITWICMQVMLLSYLWEVPIQVLRQTKNEQKHVNFVSLWIGCEIAKGQFQVI